MGMVENVANIGAQPTRDDLIIVQAMAAKVWETLPKKEVNRLKSIAGRARGTDKAQRAADEIAYAIQKQAVMLFTKNRDPELARFIENKLCKIPLPVEFFVH